MIVALAFAGTRATHAQADAGTRALEYLKSQQSATDGSLAGGFSVNDLYAIGAAAGGYDPSLQSHGGPSVMDYLSANAASACPASGSATASAGSCGELLQAVVAAGRAPHAFGGLDIVSRLTAYFDAGTSKYGDGQAFTQALAIQGLVAAGQAVPAAALTFLHNAEDSDGGWDFMDVKDDPNAATNFDTSDSNSTAMVVMALDAAGDHARDTAALTWLHTLQNPDGGIPFSSGASDPDSTALAVQAIVATGADPAGSAWTVNSHTPASDLVSTQDATGGYTFPGNTGPDAFTTSQVPPALFGAAFPVPSFTAAFTPAMEHRASLNGLLYLRSQQSATDGSIPGGFSANDLYVIGTAATRYDPNLLTHGGPSTLDYLSSNAGSACPASGSAGNCGYLLQAVLAAGRDPHAFGGVDVISRLAAYFDAATGKYGDGEAFTQSLAVQGLVAAGQAVPAAALTFLHNAENKDGGWDFMDVKDDPNAATNFDTSDSNSTAMVLMALDAAGDHSRDAAGLTWVQTLQNADGGFSFQGGGSDPDSTAVVVQGILATGGDPTGSVWTVDGHTPMSDLVSTQDVTGGYAFPGSPVDPFTTSEVPPALALVAFPPPPASQLYTKGTPLGGSPPPPTPSPTPSPSGPPAGVVTPPPAAPPSSAAIVAPADLSTGPSATGSGTAAAGTSSQGGGAAAVAAATAPRAAGPAPVNPPSSPPVVAAPPSAPQPRSVAQTPAPPGGAPDGLLYALAGVAAAVIAAGFGYVMTRR
ncbi:MAG: hypothetical protein ACREN2_04655 [Candidatus Dormibacteria bacterium]